MVNRSLVIALGLSLAANVFFGGYLAGKLASGPELAGRHSLGIRHDDHGRFEDLSPPARSALRRAFRDHRKAAIEEHQDVADLHRRLVAVLNAETFDRTAADALADELETVEASFRSGMARIVIEAADGLSTEDRQSLARHLEKRFLRRGGPPGRPPGPPGAESPPVE